MLYRIHPARAWLELTMLEVIGTYCIETYKLKLPYDHAHDGPEHTKELKSETSLVYKHSSFTQPYQN